LHSQTLADALEARTMKGCIGEVMPVAQVLADLADPKKELVIDPLKKALQGLVASKNGYTRILVGRLMGTRLAQYVKPAGWEEIVVAGVLSPRKELVKGALTWAGKFEKLPAEVKAAVEKVAASAEDEENKRMAREVLRR
jgi:hypothetical protein